MLKKDKILNGFIYTLDFITKYWVLLALLGSFCGLLYFHVDPGYYFHSIEFQQQQNKNHEQEDILKNDFIQFHNELGLDFLYVENFDAARDEFNQVLKVEPLNQNASRGLFECDLYGDVWNSTSRPSEYDTGIIKMRLDELSKRYPTDPLPYLYLGDLYNGLSKQNNILDSYQKQKYQDQALDLYQKAINLDSSVAAAYCGMGMIYDQRKQLDKARNMFYESVKISPWNEQYRNNLAYMYYELKDYQAAISWFNDSVISDPQNLVLFIGYSHSFRCLGDLEDARKYQEQQIKLMEENSTANLQINNEVRGEIYVPINSGDTIFIHHYDDKEYYFYYDIALTYYLLGNEIKTLEYLKKANNLDITTSFKLDAKRIIESNIEDIQKAQPKLINKTSEFKNKFLE